MYLVEDFYSFQGEGRYSGAMSLFFRFGGCNLECRGFNCKATSEFDNSTLLGCDSLYAVNRKHFGLNWIKIETIDSLIERVEFYQSNLNFQPDIVITGGEPLIYFSSEIFYKFISYLVDRGYRITIETNATIEIDFTLYRIYREVIFAMGVKLANSNENFSKRVNYLAIESLIENSKDSFFKFVVDSEYLREYKNFEIVKITKKFTKTDIYIMPVGDSIESLSKNDKSSIEFCKKFGYIFSDRAHIRVYNRRIGV